MFQNLLSKVGDLTEINHHLGRVKDTLLTESGHYIENFKADVQTVGEMVKHESEKINGNFFNSKLNLPTLKTEQKECEYQFLTEIPKSIPTTSNPPVQYIAFIDENDVFEEPEDDLSSKCTYFCDDDEDIEGNEEHENLRGSPSNIGDIFKQSKSAKLKKLKQKTKVALTNCKINAQVEAEVYREVVLRENPIHDFLTENNSSFTNAAVPDLKCLKTNLEVKVLQSNATLLKLIREKESLQQRAAECLADIKDLTSIM